MISSVLSPAMVPNTSLHFMESMASPAAAAGEAVDSMKWSEVLGTIAGDNTLLIIGRSNEAIENLQMRINNLNKR